MGLIPSITAHLYKNFSQFSDDNVYAIGSTIELQWQTNYSILSLAMWQNNNNSFQYLFQSQTAVFSLLWNVNLTGLYSLSDGNGTL